MLINGEETFAMTWKAVMERTMEVSSVEGLETDDCALSTILIWTAWPGMQVLGTAALMHLTSYTLPHAAPLFHIPSPAEPNMLVDGNCDAPSPKHSVAVLSQFIYHNNENSVNQLFQHGLDPFLCSYSTLHQNKVSDAVTRAEEKEEGHLRKKGGP